MIDGTSSFHAGGGVFFAGLTTPHEQNRNEKNLFNLFYFKFK